MLSVILYGRNDSYGYNLHKRAVLSLNCISELLNNDDDEILFVDYNTSSDFPSFPEAVSDLLTEKCKKYLKVLRVSEQMHYSNYGDKTSLKTLEPVARNVAIRRTNPKNKWVLSTNTDLIFVPKNKNLNLSYIVNKLPLKQFCGPRFEIPESIWEGFDRLDPRTTINNLSKLGNSVFLKEVVRGDPWNLYDAPGDVQLVPRQTLFEVRGFDETMLSGWHCDSNLNRRLFLLNDQPGDTIDLFDAYHCDHTRQITHLHSHKSSFNDPYKYVYDLKEHIAKNDENWGLAQEKIDSFSLMINRSHLFVSSLENALSKEVKKITYSSYTNKDFEMNTLPMPHVTGFIADHFTELESDARVLWFGAKTDLFLFLQKFLQKWDRKIELIHTDDLALHSFRDYSIVLVDLPYSKSNKDNEAGYKMLNQINLKCFNISHNLTTKFIFIDAMATRYETFIRSTFSCAKTPYSARILVGKLEIFSAKKRMSFRLASHKPKLDVMILNLHLKKSRLRIYLLNNRKKRPVLFFVCRLAYKTLTSLGFKV